MDKNLRNYLARFLRAKFILIASFLILFLTFTCFASHEIDQSKRIFCDSDSNCYLLPQGPISEPVPALIYLSCTGAKPENIDSVKSLADSLGWAIATCAKSRNHRDGMKNEVDIINLVSKLKETLKVDPERIVLFGFSGQGAQAWGTALRHPNLIRATVTQCAHTGGITWFSPKASKDQLFYIITRTQDWNYPFNDHFEKTMKEKGIATYFEQTPGEHAIGPHSKILRSCRWIEENWKTECFRTF
jgi:predicted esterase